jgi:ankyrin repeat protein
MSQANVLTKLNNFLQEFKEGKREGSVISAQTVDSFCTNDREFWHTIQRELEDIGITVAAFNANKEFIFEWFLNAVRTGAFDERSSDGSTISEPHELFTTVIKSASREHLGPKASKSDAPVQQAAMSSPMMALPSKNTIGTVPPDPLFRHVTAPKPHIPRIAALIAGISRPNKSLITAAEQNYPSKVREILNDQKKAVWLDKKSLNRALRAVARQGHEQAVRLLLQKGADVNAEGLGYASREGHEQIVRLLLEKGADVNAQQRSGDTALGHASKAGHEQIVRLLLEKGANVNARPRFGNTALGHASEAGHEQIVRLLLEKGANVDARQRFGDTVLGHASEAGHEQIVRLLLEKGANVNVEHWGKTALGQASAKGREQIVRLLLEKGANVDTRGTYCQLPPLVDASQNGHEQIVRLLLEKGFWDDTALGYASAAGHEQIVRLLLEKGADVNASLGTYCPPLIDASQNGNEQIVRLLLENGANIEATWNGGRTALACASRNGNEQIVRLLLQNGADVDGKHGWETPLKAAKYKRHKQVVHLLLEHGAVDTNRKVLIR